MRWMMLSRAVLAFVAATMFASAGQAHAILVDSQPPLHGTLPAGTVAIRLQFNSRIDRSRSILTLVASSGSPQRLPIGAEAPPDVMAAQATLGPGAYVLRWQVLAVDGHITRGDVSFTAAAP